MNYNKLKRYEELLGVKMRLDKFFTMFLDQYGDQMDQDNVETPIWKLYKAKLNEYSNVSSELRTLEYWLSKTEDKMPEEQVERVKLFKVETETAETQKNEKLAQLEQKKTISQEEVADDSIPTNDVIIDETPAEETNVQNS